MKRRDKQATDEGLRPINPIRAWLLKIWGPADSWDNPLVGTKYDPVVKQHHELQHRAERRAHREQQRRAREEHGLTVAHENEEHFTPDA